jgi:N-acetylglucosamine-6-phosphate deacetylase
MPTTAPRRRPAAGFIDLQVNGGGGVLFNDQPNMAGIAAIARAHRRFGTTGMLPTLISDDLDVIARAIAAVDDAIDAGVPGILGIHIEGPFPQPGPEGHSRRIQVPHP